MEIERLTLTTEEEGQDDMLSPPNTDLGRVQVRSLESRQDTTDAGFCTATRRSSPECPARLVVGARGRQGRLGVALL